MCDQLPETSLTSDRIDPHHLVSTNHLLGSAHASSLNRGDVEENIDHVCRDAQRLQMPSSTALSVCLVCPVLAERGSTQAWTVSHHPPRLGCGGRVIPCTVRVRRRTGRKIQRSQRGAKRVTQEGKTDNVLTAACCGVRLCSGAPHQWVTPAQLVITTQVDNRTVELLQPAQPSTPLPINHLIHGHFAIESTVHSARHRRPRLPLHR